MYKKSSRSALWRSTSQCYFCGIRATNTCGSCYTDICNSCSKNCELCIDDSSSHTEVCKECKFCSCCLSIYKAIKNSINVSDETQKESSTFW